MEEEDYIYYLKHDQPQIWRSILSASKEGLIFIDEGNDSITATARLLVTYPDLHEVINMLAEQWIQKKTREMRNPLIDLINKEETPND